MPVMSEVFWLQVYSHVLQVAATAPWREEKGLEKRQQLLLKCHIEFSVRSAELKDFTVNNRLKNRKM